MTKKRPDDPNEIKDIFTTEEAADYLGISVQGVKYHVHVSGKLKGTLLTPRLRVYTRTELDALAEELDRTPGEGRPPQERKPGRPRKDTDDEA